MAFVSLLTFGDTGWGDELLAGLWVTIRLAVMTLPLGLLIGLVIASASRSKNRAARGLGKAYVVLFRGLPELLTVFLVYNGAALLLNAALRSIDPEARFVELSPFIAGMTALGLAFGAYASEVLRGALQALDPGQAEAAHAIGMSHWQIVRRITLPQVWRFALPGLGNLWINLIKDTALVSIIALDDLMRAANVAVGVTKQPFTFYLVICLMYWVLCLISETLIGKLERRANRGVVRA